MKVYLAARFSRKEEMQGLAHQLALKGVEVTSRWIREKVDSNASLSDITQYYMREVAFDDIEDIQDADAFVLFTESPDVPFVRGGRHWETGYAYGIGKPVIICGPQENIFHALPNVVRVEDQEALKHYLSPVEVH